MILIHKEGYTNASSIKINYECQRAWFDLHQPPQRGKQVMLLLGIQYNLSEQGLKTLERQPRDQRAPLMWADPCDASFLAASLPEVHSTGFKTSWSSDLKATIWETSGHNLYSSKNSSLMNPSVMWPVQSLDFLLVWRPFCRLHVCTYMYWLLREIKSFLFGRSIEHGHAVLVISSFSCGSSCEQHLNQLLLHSSCSGQNNLAIHYPIKYIMIVWFTM